MKHDLLAGFGLAVFWLHVIVACVLLMFLIGGKEPKTSDWFGVGWESLAIDFTPNSLLPEATPKPSPGKGRFYLEKTGRRPADAFV
jgi:hypothetical protein